MPGALRRIALLAATVAGLFGCAPAGPAPSPSPSPSTPGATLPDTHTVDSFAFGVIGDIPYGPAQAEAFPGRVQGINKDAELAFVVHLGDIKDSASPCTDAYNEAIRQSFEAFRAPLIYTPGDNEWSDCHRPEAGSHNPLERLSAVRRVFFSESQSPLAGDFAARSQSGRGLPENVVFSFNRTSFAALHTVGPDNGTGPWGGLRLSAPTPEQAAEAADRTAAGVDLIHTAFAQARENGDRSVVLFTQADMFPPGTQPPGLAAFRPLVQALASEAAGFEGSVYLFNGDTHTYAADNPLAAGSPWLAQYGVADPVPHFHRVTIEGAENVTGWLKVRVFPSWTTAEDESAVTWLKVPYSG